MAPTIAAGFGASIFMLIKVIVHMRKNPKQWAVYTAPFFFLVAGTICTLSIVYKGSPSLGLAKKPKSYIVAVTMGVGGGLCVLSAIFFVPYVHSVVIKKDPTVKWWMFLYGPLLFKRPAPAGGNLDQAVVPNYAVVQDDADIPATPHKADSASEDDIQRAEKGDAISPEIKSETTAPVISHEDQVAQYKQIMADGDRKLKAKLLLKRGPMGWAMRTLRDNPYKSGEIYETHNMMVLFKRLPAQIVCGLLYGFHYDIHAAQSGLHGTPEGVRMERVYSYAEKYSNEVEHCYSFVQVLTACTASFAHGANDIGNSVGPWAVIYGAWSTGNAAAAKAPVPVWQLAVLSATISVGLITYGYNIMKGKQIQMNHIPRQITNMQ